MVVNFEFLGEEPIENLITCLNFQVDKVVFFGYQEVIEKQKEQTERFLKNYCNVKTVVFHALSYNDLQSTLQVMRREVQYERSQKNKIFFDITGGECLILVAFGMLSREFETPMHMYDVEKDKLIELDAGTKACISSDATTRKIPMTLELMVQMHGGVINSKLRKETRLLQDTAYIADAESIYQVAKQYWDYWNAFSDFLRRWLKPVHGLQVDKKMQFVEQKILLSNSKLKSLDLLNQIIDALAAAKVLLDVERSRQCYKFRFKNEKIKECLWDGGSILELHTYQKERSRCSECQVGIHLDWDGVIHNTPGTDVLNEIDVLSLEGNVPTFISCKSGRLEGPQALHALYELDTVARRFGGKYAKKVLVTTKELSEVYFERAKEMGIEVRW